MSHVAPCWLYVFCTLGLLVPACLRDVVYRRVARNRIRLFGAVDTCRRATKEDRRHFGSNKEKAAEREWNEAGHASSLSVILPT